MKSAVQVVSLLAASASAFVLQPHVLPTPRPITVSVPKMMADASRLVDVFKRFDTDGNGWLDENELLAAFNAAGHNYTPDEAHHAFTLIDADKNGKIDFDEFVAAVDQAEGSALLSSLSSIAARDNGHFFEDVSAFPDSVSLRDKRLAEKNPREFCLDRCLATGYCDALEDLMEMTTLEVKKFCDSCSHEDECVLQYA